MQRLLGLTLTAVRMIFYVLDLNRTHRESRPLPTCDPEEVPPPFKTAPPVPSPGFFLVADVHDYRLGCVPLRVPHGSHAVPGL